MDRETLDWIASNKPEDLIIPPQISLSSEDIELLSRYVPPKAWFLNPLTYDSIHGVRHILRVMINTLTSSSKLELSEVLLKLALTIAMIHDIRRNDDKADPEHGIRAARWFEDNNSEVTKLTGVNYSAYQIGLVAKVTSLHDLDYIEAENISEFEMVLLDLIKTADALDRYRQPKLKWWPNNSYFKTVPSASIKSFAYHTIVNSEQIYLDGSNSVDSVFNSLKKS
ncbi:hypothetical protein KBC70_03720 [Candidatus Woesebacteria bacterium]|nr:hypothetical protein [Candidatus Woesebacteria bacterium]